MKAKKLACYLVTLATLSVFPVLNAEIEKLTLKWSPELCTDSCVKGIYQYMKQVDGIAEIKVNKAAGQADIRWKPHKSFSYYTIDEPMKMVGLYVKDIRVRVRGVVEQSSDNIKLISLGDNTSFDLLGTIHTSQYNASARNNPQSHPLSPDMVQQLVDAQQKHLVVTIEGPIFEAYRSPPLLLVVEQLHIDKAPATKSENQ